MARHSGYVRYGNMTMHTLEKRKILVIDDDQNVLSGLRRNLGDLYDIVTAASSEKALRIMEKETPGLIILDALLSAVKAAADLSHKQV